MNMIAGKVIKFYSSIIAKNIPLFLAAGFLTLLPYDASGQASEMIYRMVLPVLMGYMAGRKAGRPDGEASGLAGALAAVAVVVAGPVSAIAPSIAAGGLAGYLFYMGSDRWNHKIPVGFEMLFRNVLVVLAGAVSAGGTMILLIPVLEMVNGWMSQGLVWMMEKGMVPWVSILIEPMKILFLNNWVNHGFLVPMGLEQVQEAGQSVLFLLEANPGPGLGILAAVFITCRQKRDELSSGIVIEFLGGIHEVYFPYVLADGRLLLAVIAGGVVGNLCFITGDIGLMGTAAPGSVLLIMMLCKLGGWPGLILGIFASALVSGMIAWGFMRRGNVGALQKGEGDRKAEGDMRTEEDIRTEEAMKIEEATEHGDIAGTKEVKRKWCKSICFVCDAGIGSSAMGAALLRRKIKSLGITGVSVSHAAMDEVPEDADVLICQKNISVRISGKQGEVLAVENLTDGKEYEALLERLKRQEMAEETGNG